VSEHLTIRWKTTLRESGASGNGKVRRFCEEAVEPKSFLWKGLEKWAGNTWRSLLSPTVAPQMKLKYAEKPAFAVFGCMFPFSSPLCHTTRKVPRRLAPSEADGVPKKF
jgi:hypothetical protein